MATREGWSWVSPKDGEVIDFTQFVHGLEKLRGGSGFGAPPVEIRREPVPLMPGARTLNVRHGINEVTLPLYAIGNDRQALLDLLERMAVYMDPTLGDGTLRHDRLDGTTRELFCRCVGGLGIDGDGEQGPRAKRLQLVFQAADEPYWQGGPRSKGFPGGSAPSWFPRLPIRLGAAIVIGDVTVVNTGQVPAWPVWTIMGPGEAPRLENVTTGQVLEMSDVELTAGEVITIDTRPYQKRVIGPDGSNWFQYLTSRSMFPLQPGSNDISMTLVGATSSSYVSVAYRERYLTS